MIHSSIRRKAGRQRKGQTGHLAVGTDRDVQIVGSGRKHAHPTNENDAAGRAGNGFQNVAFQRLMQFEIRTNCE